MIQKRKLEKLPVDIIPSSEQTLDKCEQVVAVEMDVTNTKIGEPQVHTTPPAEALISTQGLCLRS